MSLQKINMEDNVVKEMRKFICAIFAFALVLSVSASVVFAEDQPAATSAAPESAAPAAPAAPAVTGSAAMSVLSHYVFRGYELSAKSVVFQPSLTINYSGFSANLWSNIDSKEHATRDITFVSPGRGHNNYNETDLTLSYTYNIDKLALTGGYIYYDTQYAPETGEVFISGTYDMIAHPTLAIYRDVYHYPGTYFNLSFSQSIPVYKMANGDVTVDLGASFGYEAGSSNYWDTYVANKGYVGSKYSALHDGMTKVGLTLPVTKMLSVQPVVQYWFPLSSDASKKVIDHSGLNSYNPNGRLSETFVAGANLTFSF